MTIPLFAGVLLFAGSPTETGEMAFAPSLPIAAPASPVAAEQTVPTPPMQSAPPPTVPTLPTHHAEGDPGEIVVMGKNAPPPPGDPLEKVNAQSFEITQAVDRAVIRPVALTYQRILPEPLRDGFRNVLNNLREPVAFLNFLLQIKIGKAVETVGRFAINSTIGAAGLFDVAKRYPVNLPRRPNGFANTFGFYGIKSGPFLYLPIVGPTTIRDFIGDGLDRLVLPLAIGKPFTQSQYAIPLGVFSSLDQRAEFDEKLQAHHKDSDPYAKTREDYLANRQAAIDALKGKKRDVAAPVAEVVKPGTQ